METTVINHDIGRSVLGYVVNATFDVENQQKIHGLQQQVSHLFGDAIWSTPVESLHVTLVDWLAPLVDYGNDKEQLFGQLYERYDAALSEVFLNQAPIDVVFNQVKVTSGAIILVGQDNGAFERIRQDFIKKVDLLPGTKRPPQIIHSSIMRYKKEKQLQSIIDSVPSDALSFTQTIRSFRLIKETILPQLEFKRIKEYRLTAK